MARRLIGWVAAYAFILQAVLAGIIATQAAASAGAAGTHFELCLADPDGAAHPGRSQREHCAIHCAIAGGLPALAFALVALLFPVPVTRRVFDLFPVAHIDLLRRAGLGSRAPPHPA